MHDNFIEVNCLILNTLYQAAWNYVEDKQSMKLSFSACSLKFRLFQLFVLPLVFQQQRAELMCRKQF